MLETILGISSRLCCQSSYCPGIGKKIYENFHAYRKNIFGKYRKYIIMCCREISGETTGMDDVIPQILDTDCLKRCA